MQYASHYIAVGNEQLHYLLAGTGRRLLIGVPGYGHDAGSLLCFIPYLQQEYTCVLVDMPHHGKSNWRPGSTFTKAMLSGMVTDLLKKHKCDTVALLGYSMGGRVCLTIIEQMPQVVAKATLMATDGLAWNFYYSFFTRTMLGRHLFSSMLYRPAPYLRIIKWLKAHKWISEWQYKFVSYYTGDQATRKKLSLIWPAMSPLIPSAKAVKTSIRKYKIPVNLFMGKFDKVIPATLGQKFADGLPGVQLTILDKGHQIIGADTAKQIAQTLI